MAYATVTEEAEALRKAKKKLRIQAAFDALPRCPPPRPKASPRVEDAFTPDAIARRFHISGLRYEMSKRERKRSLAVIVRYRTT